jgi:hypothetical protein
MARRKKQDDGEDILPEEVAEQRRNDKESEFFDDFKALIEERNEINARLAELRQEVKDVGLNSRVIEKAARDSLKDPETVKKEAIFENAVKALKARLGAFVNTPLGEAALATAAE